MMQFWKPLWNCIDGVAYLICRCYCIFEYALRKCQHTFECTIFRSVILYLYFLEVWLYIRMHPLRVWFYIQMHVLEVWFYIQMHHSKVWCIATSYIQNTFKTTLRILIHTIEYNNIICRTDFQIFNSYRNKQLLYRRKG